MSVFIEHSLPVPDWVQPATETALGRIRTFAEDTNDGQWHERYLLGMASNLLGLPASRIQKGMSVSALSLYVEGLRYLDAFCTSTGMLA